MFNLRPYTKELNMAITLPPGADYSKVFDMVSAEFGRQGVTNAVAEVHQAAEVNIFLDPLSLGDWAAMRESFRAHVATNMGIGPADLTMDGMPTGTGVDVKVKAEVQVEHISFNTTASTPSAWTPR